MSVEGKAEAPGATDTQRLSFAMGPRADIVHTTVAVSVCGRLLRGREPTVQQ